MSKIIPKKGTGVCPASWSWSSSDGQHWTRETGSAGFSPRVYHQAVYRDEWRCNEAPR
ncbi:MAG: hypothetical protein WC586_09420 [Methanoregula sp.]